MGIQRFQIRGCENQAERDQAELLLGASPTVDTNSAWHQNPRIRMYEVIQDLDRPVPSHFSTELATGLLTGP